MKRFDPDGDLGPESWRSEFTAWKIRAAHALILQNAALQAYNVALDRANRLAAFQSQLNATLADVRSRIEAHAALEATLVPLTQQLTDLEGQLADRIGARDTATSRLIGGPATAHPLVLLPVRVHTAWTGSTLAVRILPSEVNLDRHDPRLSPLETTLGQAYWATRALSGAGQADQAWADLTRRLTPPRAAWVVRATDPAAPSALPPQASDLDAAVTVRLWPDRFAVVLLAKGEPVNVSQATTPAFTSWGAAVAPDVPVPLLHGPSDRPWTTDLDTAITAGLALRITLPAGSPAIDELVVVGIRATSGPADLADLLEHHVYGAGVEVLADGAVTNNSAAARSGRSEDTDLAALRELVAGPLPTTLSGSSGGHQLAAMLGIPDASVAMIPGAASTRGAVADAVGVLVQVATRGTLTRRYNVAPSEIPMSPVVGVAPALRVGRQPYGILPAVDAARWQAADLYDALRFVGPMHDTALAHQPVLDDDPAQPVPAVAAARRVTRDDDSAIATILTESAASVGWASSAGSWTDLDAVVGPASGPQSAATYLGQLAEGVYTPDVLASASSSVLGAVAVTAASAPGAAAAMTTLATAATTPQGLQAISVALGAHLDSLSHRLDAWVTAAAYHRRTVTAIDPPVVGAYGYLTDVAPRTAPRSFGHIHAPSLAHAATASVLRSGYLGQRRTAWAGRLAAAIAAGDLSAMAAARTGLAALAPLDTATESRLPMAIDLSSRRIRRARSLLGAVRQGQPLAAVLGQQFERGLVEAGLQRYLAAFRKLTRFSTGSELEALEAARRVAGDALLSAHTTADMAHAIAERASRPVTAATTDLDTATAAYKAATAAWMPFHDLVTARTNELAAAAAAQVRLNALLAAPPRTTTHTRTVSVP